MSLPRWNPYYIQFKILQSDDLLKYEIASLFVVT